ncbi:MAG: ADP-ribosylglycohydrolase family protein, partial [Chloroflexales bacterium]
GVNPQDQAKRYWRWAKRGENSSTGQCFDIGMTVSTALAYHAASNWTADYVPNDPNGEGNGSLMRLAPIALFYHRDPLDMQIAALHQSHVTHGGYAAAEACETWALLILAAAEDGATKETVQAVLEAAELTDPRLIAIVTGRTYLQPRSAIRGTGYVVQSFEAALWAFFATESYRAAVLAAANLGEDADTTAAITGQLAGAFYGIGGATGIPQAWTQRITHGDRIATLARDLIAARQG